jgi:regulatory protein
VKRITALEPDPSQPGLVRVVVNGHTYCSVPADRVRTTGLSAGAAFDEAATHAVDQAADEEAAYRMLLGALERRPFATGELRRRLIRKGHRPEAVDPALARAQAAGLLNDLEFARGFVRSRSERGRGPARIRRDLAVLGIDRGVIDRALSGELPPDHDPIEAAEVQARRRAAQLADLPRPTTVRRVVAYLARRGYTGHDVTEMVRRVVDQRRRQRTD